MNGRRILLTLVVALLICAQKEIVVRAGDGGSTLERFEGGRAIGKPIRVTIGKKGIAPAGSKVEGDLKTPAGTFRIVGAAGYDAKPPEGTKLPYTRSIASLKCVDDPKSAHYNTLADERAVKKDWAHAEEMLRDDALYRFVLLIDYNTHPVEPEKGSCIFLHVWKDERTATAGCVAMPLADLEILIRWADADTRITIAPAK